ncbi:APC family permease [Paracoccus sp. MKU1]|uniref:APC family permease n=1 Tax=Paracoccus sp. MKU1 TaxID=1745182 RepID=UPI00071913C6|nr:APC family permease [Paracoccus sp. MKU1]KRW95219.1 hypothetical protein AQY21_15575 [Paracoccus sp. MKU1]
MKPNALTGGETPGLEKGALGVFDIVFMVVAVAAPLGVVASLQPIAFAYGNGAGVPGAYLLTMIALFLFALGYVKIIPHVKNAGAFYAYITSGLGKELGLAAAYVSVLSYTALSASTLSAFGFFGMDTLRSWTGIETPWWLWAIGGAVLVAILAHHKITLTAKVLGVLLMLEILLLLGLDLAILFSVGGGGYEIGDFAPSTVFGAGLGIALIYGFSGMIGIESTAIYQEEAVNRKRTIPLATFVALFLAGGFYVLTSWSLSSAVGSGNVQAVAGENPGHFVFGIAATHLGGWSISVFGVLILSSTFAAALGLYNNAARYIYALARDNALPRPLAQTHPKHHSPYVAGYCLALFVLTIMVAAALAGLDPLLNVTPALVGVGSVGLMSLLALTSFAIPVYFMRRGEIGLAKTAAPALGGVIVASATYQAMVNYSALTGVDDPVVNSLIWILAICFAVGILQAVVTRISDADRFASFGTSRVEK